MMKAIAAFQRTLSGYLRIATLKKPYFRNESILTDRFTRLSISKESRALDLGSGPVPKNPFQASCLFGADLRENQENNVLYADLGSGVLPFEASSFDYVTAFDVLEHIQRVVTVNGETQFPFVSLLNEIFRILKSGGILFSVQPCFPSKEAFQDPTHVNIMTEDTLNLYFCQPAWARIYGFEGSFEMLDDGWIGGKYFAFMRKSLDRPIRNLSHIQK